MPEKTCIYTFMVVKDGVETLYECYLSAKKILEENELEVDGEVISRGLIFANNSKYVYREVWIPVKKKTKNTIDSTPSAGSIVK
ncbi:MAG: hypothetical protein GX339_02480 [Tissierellia bacterium]|nr:hypothetical protein [Tissierellia bacterium]